MENRFKKYLSAFMRREEPLVVKSKPITPVTVPGSRVSKPVLDDTFHKIKNKTTFVNPSFIAEYIPVIRKLSWINPDMGQVVNELPRMRADLTV